VRFSLDICGFRLKLLKQSYSSCASAILPNEGKIHTGVEGLTPSCQTVGY
jgi:hypothetical protein